MNGVHFTRKERRGHKGVSGAPEFFETFNTLAINDSCSVLKE